MCIWKRKFPGIRGRRSILLTAIVIGFSLCLAGCGRTAKEDVISASEEEQAFDAPGDGRKSTDTEDAVKFDHELDGYRPLKEKYNFYFTYKVGSKCRW